VTVLLRSSGIKDSRGFGDSSDSKGIKTLPEDRAIVIRYIIYQKRWFFIKNIFAIKINSIIFAQIYK
jgi:hypothetical protein